MGIKLTKEEKKRLSKEIQDYFLQERDEELGIIATEKMLDFFGRSLGSLIYNKALDDARIWFMNRMEDIGYDYDLLYKQQS